MRTLTAIACLALLSATLAGCSEDPERYPDGLPSTSSSRSGTGSATGTGSSTRTSTGPGGNGTGNEPPVVSLTAAINGTNATFSINGTDADNDTLVWDLDFGDGNATNGTGLPAMANHTYAAGNYTVNLTVSDGTDAVLSNVTVVIGDGNGGGGGGSTNTVVVADPAGDEPGPYDITQVTASITDTELVVVFKVAVAGPGAGDWPALYRAYVGELILEAYVLQGGGVWNVGENEDPGGGSEWNPAAGTVTMRVPIDYVDERASRPFAVFFDSQVGEGQAGGLQQMDRAPDAGTVTLG